MTPSLHNVLIVNDDNKECVKLMSWNKQIPGKTQFLEQKPEAKQKKAGGKSGAGP